MGGVGKPEDISGAEMYPVAIELDQSEFTNIAETVASMPVSDYQEWADNNLLSEGEKIYSVCASCHGAEAQGNEALKAPPLNVQGGWYIKKQLHNFQNAHTWLS